MLQQSTPSRPRYILSLILKALKGHEQDYTTGSLRYAIVMLAIPMILEMGMESVFAVVDLFFVARIGKHAVSTVGLTESVITLVYSLAIGLSMAATAVVARRIGEKDKEGAALAAMQAIWIGVAVAAIVSMIGLVWAGDLLRLMGAEKETIAIGQPYVRVMFGSSLFIILLFLINGIFRGAGDASIAMRSLWLANTCNIILCPLLINGLGPVPALGLTGAAVATAIGRGIGVLYQLVHLFNGKSLIRIKVASLRWHATVVKSLAQVAWPAILQFIIGSCSWIFLARLVAETGHSEASAGYQTALRMIMFFLLPAWGISNAAATLVGQNLGAQNTARAEQAVLQTAKYNALFMAFVSLLFFVFAEGIIGFFAHQPDVRRFGIQALRIISCGFIFYGIGMVLNNAFNGAGDTRTPTFINVAGFWVFQIPLAYVLAKALALGPVGVFISIPVAETVMTIAAFVLFKRGRWKTVQV
ncbi:MAG TPA: MATE family efflux transporter [Chitinophagaceae bacterium]|nr:MATE family efflux transporter [Chitinophagaceae bacterium]